MYFDGSIGTDLHFLRNVVVRVETLNHFIWVPVAVVRQAIRSIVRIMYFVHSYSHENNYELMRYMFVHRTEHDSNVNGVVQLRPLLDEIDNFLYPLYSKKIPFTEMNITRHVWTIGTGISDLYVQDDEQEESEYIVKYIVCTYASWAYDRMFGTSGTSLQADVIELAQRTYLNCKNAFSVKRFVEEFRKHPSNRYTKLIAGYVSADDIARAILKEPRTIFARTIAASVKPTYRRKLDRNTVRVCTGELLSISCTIN